jgi:HEAT repeat protein
MERLLRPPDCEWPEELHDVIARALGHIGAPAIQALIDVLDAPDVWISSAAARALGQIGATQAIVPLTKLIKHENKWLRSAATQSLAQIADTRAVRAALTTDEAPRAFWKLMALKEINASTINRLMTLLQDPDQQIRDRAAQVLGQFDQEGSVSPLGATLRAETQHLSHAYDAVQGKHDGERATEAQPLLNALRDNDTEVRLAAAEALGKIGDAHAVMALNQALQDKDSRVRAAAARSLGEISKKLVG